MKMYKKPNVLLIYTDQQRQDSLRCYGNEYAISPNLDKLAEEGVRFDSYYVNSPVCTPSRMSFLTGRYCSSIGVGCNGILFPKEIDTLWGLLKPYGYHTAQIGKLHFDPHSQRDHRDPTDDYGFDTFILSDEPGCYNDAYTKWVETLAPEQLPKVRASVPPAAQQYGIESYSDVPRNTHEPYVFEGDEEYSHSAFVASETCRFIEEIGDQNFFAIAGFYAPHTPVNPPQRFIDMFDIDKAPWPIHCDPEKAGKQIKGMSKEDIKKMVAYYYALCAHVDDCVGQILDTLEKTGKADNTIVIFTTDHGEYLGDYNRIQKGMPGNRSIANVPFIVRYPDGLKGGTVIDEIVEGVDMVPTILDYAAIQTPRSIQGKSFKKLMEGKENSFKDTALIELFNPYNTTDTRSIVTKRFLYFVDAQNRESLFDRDVDPTEFTNFANDENYNEHLSEMRKQMIVKLKEASFDARERPAKY